jgi:hypothetical protein
LGLRSLVRERGDHLEPGGAARRNDRRGYSEHHRRYRYRERDRAWEMEADPGKDFVRDGA